ncbi:hypothetical protein [Marinomonas mediterranea]|uniref:hypothetical protein n=1 Tax=Marinomonas mediterranea TaxID=119864 RepID=UPI002349239F|nr:hypothetical protein [Marinomonas mediterranea]WCN09978.1 hypothetical protein GV055_14140 [Marinomonas mediterranea]
MNSQFNKAGEVLSYLWDWPNTKSNNYSSEEKKRLSTLSSLFTTVAGLGSGALAYYNGSSTTELFICSSVAVVSAHYLAGITSELTRDRL